jgi:hypothetical protein
MKKKFVVLIVALIIVSDINYAEEINKGPGIKAFEICIGGGYNYLSMFSLNKSMYTGSFGMLYQQQMGFNIPFSFMIYPTEKTGFGVTSVIGVGAFASYISYFGYMMAVPFYGLILMNKNNFVLKTGSMKKGIFFLFETGVTFYQMINIIFTYSDFGDFAVGPGFFIGGNINYKNYSFDIGCVFDSIFSNSTSSSNIFGYAQGFTGIISFGLELRWRYRYLKVFSEDLLK